jgi:hypothetical protein
VIIVITNPATATLDFKSDKINSPYVIRYWSLQNLNKFPDNLFDCRNCSTDFICSLLNLLNHRSFFRRTTSAGTKPKTE